MDDRVVFMCTDCDGHFPTSQALGGHRGTKHPKHELITYTCEGCLTQFSTRQQLGGHIRQLHPGRTQSSLLKLRHRREARARRAARKFDTVLGLEVEHQLGEHALCDYGALEPLLANIAREPVHDLEIKTPALPPITVVEGTPELKIEARSVPVPMTPEEYEGYLAYVASLVAVPGAGAPRIDRSPTVVLSQAELEHIEVPIEPRKKGSLGKAILTGVVIGGALVGGIWVLNKLMNPKKEEAVPEPLKPLLLTKAHFGLTEDAGKESRMFVPLDRTGLTGNVIS